MVKVLVCGDAKGRIKQLVARVDALQKSQHGPFQVLLCCGCFAEADAEWNELVDGTVSLPIPTYIFKDGGADGETAAVTPTSIAHNLFILRRAGTFVLEGLTIAYIGTRANASDIALLRKQMSSPSFSCDILLSQLWPSDMHQFLADGQIQELLSLGASIARGSGLVSDAAVFAAPRYHFAGGTIYYQRPPYRNDGKEHVTRFISMAGVSQSKAKHQKWLHALDLEPTASTLAPEGSTDCPYVAVGQESTRKRPRTEGQFENDDTSDKSAGAFFFGAAAVPRKPAQEFDKQDSEKRTVFVGGVPRSMTDSDFLPAILAHGGLPPDINVTVSRTSSAQPIAFLDFETHEQAARLLAAGERVHLSKSVTLNLGWGRGRKRHIDFGDTKILNPETRRLASRSDCWFCLSSPNAETHLIVSVGAHIYMAIPKGGLVDEHVLLVPINCVSSRQQLPQEAREELQQYLAALKTMFAAKECKPIVFERFILSRTKGNCHMHTQVVPVPNALLGGSVNVFMQEADRIRLSFQEVLEEKMNIEDVFDSDQYFFIEIPTATNTKRFIRVLQGGEHIPMEFGREIACKILGTPERAFWKSCLKSQDDETLLAERIKQNFMPFDFTLDK